MNKIIQKFPGNKMLFKAFDFDGFYCFYFIDKDSLVILAVLNELVKLMYLLVCSFVLKIGLSMSVWFGM